jgi:hypothetical protein
MLSMHRRKIRLRRTKWWIPFELLKQHVLTDGLWKVEKRMKSVRLILLLGSHGR